MNLAKLLLSACLLTLVTTSYASSCDADEFYCISEQKIEIVESDTKSIELSSDEGVAKTARASDLGKVIQVTRELIAFGEEVYKVVEKGRPVVNIEYGSPVSVLPRLENGEFRSPAEMSGWNSPVAKHYKYSAKNSYGVEVVSFEFMVVAVSGGSLEGRGKYLTGALIRPTNINVIWGFELNSTMKVHSITNAGTESSPVAAVVLSLDYQIDTVLQQRRHSKSFYLTGEGEMRAL